MLMKGSLLAHEAITMRGLEIQSKSRAERSCSSALIKELELPPHTIRT
jgi:hypothetical protein